MQYEAIIGMEVHAQVTTRSKMFCGCSADYAAAPPNTHTCPVCLGMPGVLPVINQAAVEATLLTGLALGCAIPPFSKFDRKNYTYPDLPKGYQISQYDFPLCVNGELAIAPEAGPRTIRIRRVHLEEDTAKLTHAPGASLIDFNRAGVPLMEIVTEADIRSAEEADLYLTGLRAILRTLGVNSGNMEEGALRCEANISVRPVGQAEFGTKVEVKNLNSFRAVRLAIAYEFERQAALIEAGGRVQQVTMGWDDEHHRTVFQRSKESSDDYRYFPEPDLPPLEPAREWVAALRARLPELPAAKRARYVAAWGLRAEDAALLSQDRPVAEWFERVVAALPPAPTAATGNTPVAAALVAAPPSAHKGRDYGDSPMATATGDAPTAATGNTPVAAALVAAPPAPTPQMAANWMLGEVFRLLRESGAEIGAAKVTPEALAGLIGLTATGAINATSAKEVFAEMWATGDLAEAIVQRRGLAQISDADALSRAIRAALDQHPQAVQDYLAGKGAAIGFLVGQIMRATRGQANAQVVTGMLKEELGKRRQD